MKRRTAAFFAVFMVGMFLMIMKVYGISTGEQLAETADKQSTYELKVAQTRGMIYDCNLKPLVGRESEYIAAVSPTTQAANALAKALPQEEMAKVYGILTQGKPFAWKVPDGGIRAEGMDVFRISKRYSERQTASNVIGYLDGSGAGVAGIEKAYNDYLASDPGFITVKYKVDAVNRVLQGEGRKVEDTYDKEKSGVVLTLDAEIQEKTEELARAYLQKGTVVVTEVSTGKIRAMVSMPTFSPNDISSALENPDAPLMNRALAGYNVGSVFKLVSAAAALEAGVSPEEEYTCKGGIEVSGDMFHCFDGIAHGTVSMQEAIAQSCNAYFIQLMQQVPADRFLAMASSLGFGKSFEVAPGIVSKAGVLPTANELKVEKALANFSFGQGTLMVTPLQVSGLIGCIADNGIYTQPTLIEGLVDKDLNYAERTQEQAGKRVMSESTAALLKEFMAASVDHGTSRKGRPLLGMAGAKTGTAQTGEIIDGREVIQAWFAGFYPLDEPKYAVVILGEDEPGGGGVCAPIFKELTDWLALR